MPRRKMCTYSRRTAALSPTGTVNIMEVSLAPGDVVVVPQKIEYTNNFKIFMDTVDAIFKIGSVISIIVTVLILAHSLK